MSDGQGDSEVFPEVYIGSTGKSQSFDLVFKMCCRLREQNPEIAARSRKWQNKITFSNGGVIEPLMAASERLNGRNISCAIADEIGDWRSASLMDVFTSSTVGRRQPLIWSISTAGEQRDGQILWEERAHGIKVLEGVLEADSDFYLLYELDENDDYTDPSVWAKSCPSLGVLVHEDSIKNLLEQAQGLPHKLNGFLRYQVNRWPETSESSWISPDLLLQPGVAYIDAKEKDLLPIQRIEATETRLEIKPPDKPLSAYSMDELLNLPQPRKCFASLDMSQTLDLSAVCCLFPPVDLAKGIFECIFRAWTPEASLLEHEKTDRAPYFQWSRTPKILQATPGSTIDTRWIEAEVLALHKTFKIQEMGFDLRYSADTVCRLQSAGVKCTQCPTGYQLSPAIVEVQKLLTEGRLLLNGNPLVNYCFQNAEIHRAPVSGDLELRKGRQRNRIDAAMACILAMFIYMQQKPNTVGSGKVMMA
jgi:phage terminase large subunit-like protein